MKLKIMVEVTTVAEFDYVHSALRNMPAALGQRSPLPERSCRELSDSDPIEELELPSRAFKCLCRSGVVSVGKLCSMTREDLLLIPKMGAGSVAGVVAALRAFGLELAVAKP